MAGRTSRTAVAAAGNKNAPSDSGSGEGARLAEQLVDDVEDRVEQLEKLAGSKTAEAHLGPAPTTDGEEANVLYFAYGSNINKKVFEGRRMIKPAESLPAVLPGWRLTFSQPGLPYREPAFAAVERQPEASSSSNGNGRVQQQPQLDVNGIVHRITPTQWRYVLETEGASGQNEEQGYAVVEAKAVTYDGKELEGVKTLSVHAKTKEKLKGRNALPSLRYLTLIREGAQEYGLAPEYRQWLETLQHYEAVQPGQKLGGLIFGGFAFTAIFPVWGGMRLFRKLSGMPAASGDAPSRFMSSYTAFMFGSMYRMHELLRPVLGCGLTSGGSLK